ncbi:MAG: histidine phosphatase family protein [Hydrogenophaga sp.]|uniref:histidine phosphatase family protein n=1 Tax=Hydrogenophaga sp. TaxID=1904254 RepID=UPI0016B90EC2|nr:histidine phosphatase family protein [Hydrogenophaga sp.]NIM42231.1 histidine phosphatase family protein [Hydrogenophaga sp.]NIN27963.1 histidine phosphatase family protein [Hydrogenophaga sp.]NIN32741.1 histidine phosphatase family protein [Hydrogenophaga sp.]NIN54630.1 histidine phosphatase family protein [Hydrogenophaga sp.]NIO51306.1 histidine phosphatase family protein [Hydrogenophaga sp.]
MLQRRRFLAASALAAGGVRAQSTDFWARLREGGHVVLMRHAQTEPGVGDPPDFRLGECATQRNLSADGREQARRIGEAFRREAIRLDEVRSSAWCRCVDTAQLAFGRHVVWAPINSFFGGTQARETQTREVLAAVQSLRAPGNWMLVTHQVNITALTGEYLAMGEVFVTRPEGGRLRLLARQTF